MLGKAKNFVRCNFARLFAKKQFLQITIFLLVDFSLGHYDISMKLCSSIYCFERKTIVAKNAVQNISVKKYLQELIAKRIVYLHISRSFMIFT